MEMENILEHVFVFFRRRVFEVDPQEQIRITQERWHQKQVNVSAMEPALSCKNERTYHLGDETGVEPLNR